MIAFIITQLAACIALVTSERGRPWYIITTHATVRPSVLDKTNIIYLLFILGRFSQGRKIND